MPDTPGDETPPPPVWQPPTQRLPSFTPPQYAPTEYVRPATSIPPETPRRPLSRLAIGLIIGGGVLLLAAVVGSAVTVVNYISDVASGEREVLGSEPAPLEGDQASPLAVDPTVCATKCFNDFSHHEAERLSDDDLNAWGLTEEEGFHSPASVEDELDYYRTYFDDLEVTPESCFVVTPSSPILGSLDKVSGPQRVTIYFDGSRADSFGSTYYDQATRLFPDSASAVDYMVDLDTQVDDCTSYDYTLVGDTWSSEVTRTPKLDIPANVAAIGWIEVSGESRYYVYDVQRGNLVVRTTITSVGGLTELETRDLVESIAAQVSELEPDA